MYLDNKISQKQRYVAIKINQEVHCVTSVFTVVPAVAFVLFAVVLGAIGLGGGFYETLLVDRVWPDHPMIIQPSRGGLNRGLFWGPIHALYEVALLVSAWMVWSDSYARSWIIVALVVHFGTRAWSFAYFIPKALRFEKAGDLTEEQLHLARRWIRVSRCRPVLEAISIMAQGAVILHFAAGVTPS
jgi:hypothetical protein